MKVSYPSLVLVLIASIARAQQPVGAIAGMVSIDGPVADATVEATHTETGAVYSVMTEIDGYMLAGLPAGTYEIMVPPLGWRTETFEQSGVVVTAGETLRLDIRLVKQNLGVIGDDLGFLRVRNEIGDIEGETPRLADGTPDFSGVWQGNRDPHETVPDMLPWAVEENGRRVETFHRDSPEAFCLPGPMPVWPTFYRFVQTPEIIVQIFEYQGGPRQIFMGREHPENLDPSWMGHSIGWWEGDALVVDTIGFNDRSWLWNGYPHTDQLHLVERFTRLNRGQMSVHVTVDDPGALATPWELNLTWLLAPGEEVLEYVCNENNQYLANIGAE